MELVMKIETQIERKLLFINIGGGLSSLYDGDEELPETSFVAYRRAEKIRSRNI